jgi:hypothetical protein
MAGPLLGATMCFAIAVATSETARFAFDPARRRIDWRRRWTWWRRAGVIPFDHVRDVLVQSPVGDDGVPSRRIALRLADGGELPMTTGYSPDPDDAMVHLASRIRALVGLAGDESAPVAALAKTGRTIDAVRLLRQTTGVSLDEAVRRVDELRRRP